jgi:alkylresorcinol/alkylpyrone synthase
MRLFSGRIDGLERLLAVFDHARIDRRRFMMPLEWYLSPRSREERNRIYQQHGLELALAACHDCLDRAGCHPGQVDQVIFVSSTGHATPTMDCHLINRLGMKPSTERLPIWGIGCAAGAVGLSRAREHCLAFPENRSLLVALECCSLTFMAGDLTKKNLVATSLFSDGAAAVLVGGDRTTAAGPALLASRSHLFPESYQLMGWNFRDNGMELVLSPRLPLTVREELPALVDRFLAENGLARRDLVHFITHPGGAKVIDAYRQALGLTGDQLDLTEDHLRHHGNISSVSVLMILEEWLASERCRKAGHGLLSAFGPGFSAELLLLGV